MSINGPGNDENLPNLNPRRLRIPLPRGASNELREAKYNEGLKKILHQSGNEGSITDVEIITSVLYACIDRLTYALEQVTKQEGYSIGYFDKEDTLRVEHDDGKFSELEIKPYGQNQIQIAHKITDKIQYEAIVEIDKLQEAGFLKKIKAEARGHSSIEYELDESKESASDSAEKLCRSIDLSPKFGLET